jgi:hypothetical protein
MFDSSARDLADKLFRDAIRGRAKHLDGSLRKVISGATAAGGLGNGRFHAQLGDIYAEEFRARANLLWDIVQQVLSAHGVVPSVVLARELKTFLNDRLLQQSNELSGLAQRDAERFRASTSLSSAVSKELEPTEEGLDAKVDLFVLQLQRSPVTQSTTSSTVQNFYGGNVGVVQTGAGSVANSQQAITIGDVGTTERALSAMAEALKAVTEAGGFSQKELLSTVADLATESRQSQPNRLKVGQLASGLAIAVQTSAALRPAYELVRTAFLAWGINLPTLGL